ncbi:MAG: ribbon-helix-helix protein, CopG family [Thermoproteota archaeon]
MAYLYLQLHKSLLKKVKKEASRLNVKRTLLLSAAIQAFVENPPETINLLPNLNHGFERITGITLELPNDVVEKIYSYAMSKGLPAKKVAEGAITAFLSLSDEQKMIYIDKEIKRLEEKRKRKLSEEHMFQFLESIASKDPSRSVRISFKCVDDLHKLLENEAHERGTTASELVRRAVEEFLRKYGDNFKKIKKLYEAAKGLHYSKAGDKVYDLKMPAYMLLQLTKIADKMKLSTAMLIRLAIMRYLKLSNIELKKHTELQKQVSFMCAASLVSMLEEEAKKTNTAKAAIVREALTMLFQHDIDEIRELSRRNPAYPGSYMFSVMLPDSLIAQLDAIAGKIRTSRSNLIRTAIAAYFKLV